MRAVSLLNWNFQSVSKEHTFTGLLKNLNKQDEETFTLNTLQNNPVTDIEAAANALNQGYTLLNHRTRQGDCSVSWYRGLFVPYEVNEKVAVPVSSSDAVTRYNSVTGMFDVSYAAAWELGCLLALNNKGFARALYNWRRENSIKTIQAHKEEILMENLQQIHGGNKQDRIEDHIYQIIKTALSGYTNSDNNKGEK